MKLGNSPAHHHAALNTPPFNLAAGQAYEGKVITVNPDDSTVDLKLYDGQTLRRVRVLFNSANTVAGFRYLASIVNNNPQNSSLGVVDDGNLSHVADTLATIIYVQGSTLAPRVIGFSFPLDAQMHVNEQGLLINRHESGIYSLIDSNGHQETHYPDGSYIIAAADSIPKTIKSGSKAQPWNTPVKPNINLTIHLNQGVDITVSGKKITLTSGSASLAIDGNANTVTATGPIGGIKTLAN